MGDSFGRAPIDERGIPFSSRISQAEEREGFNISLRCMLPVLAAASSNSKQASSRSPCTRLQHACDTLPVLAAASCDSKQACSRSPCTRLQHACDTLPVLAAVSCDSKQACSRSPCTRLRTRGASHLHLVSRKNKQAT